MQITMDWKEYNHFINKIHDNKCIQRYLSKWSLQHYNPPWTPLITDDCICEETKKGAVMEAIQNCHDNKESALAEAMELHQKTNNIYYVLFSNNKYYVVSHNPYLTKDEIIIEIFQKK